MGLLLERKIGEEGFKPPHYYHIKLIKIIIIYNVNIASRVEGFAPIGGISLSDKVHKDIAGVSDIKTSFIGHRKLKGVEQETKIRCITSNDLPKHRKQILPLIIGYYGIYREYLIQY